RDIILSEGVEQPHPSEPRVISPVKATTDAHRRDARDVCAVGERGPHDVELVFNADKSVGDRHNVPLALKFTAPEDGVSLRIDRFVKLAHTGTTCAGVITGVSGQLSEYEAVEARVVRGCLKSKRTG